MLMLMGVPLYHPGVPGTRSAADLVQVLQQAVRRQLHLLVAPLRRPINAGDQPGPMHPGEVADDERVPSLGLVVGALGQTEVPRRILLPRVLLEVGVL